MHAYATNTAAAWARRLDPDRPAGLLAELGLQLLVRAKPLIARGRRIHGLWSPSLRRIELHGVGERDRSDEDLVRTFAHELAHALEQRGGGPSPGAETFASRFAAEFVSELDAQVIGRCASALRALATPLPASCAEAMLEPAGWMP
jgi:hypothetical protein